MTPQRLVISLWRCLAVVGCMCVLGLDSSPGVPRPRPVSVTNVDEEKKLKDINKQLEEILEVQATILTRYDELMAELDIVKVRASR
ncbi:MAG: hypothetical protein Q8R78_04125 [Candidatus Omnitrophota bacterium]|nr:hypothetical protein [Candidatus Omnitrophota bacterium]